MGLWQHEKGSDRWYQRSETFMVVVNQERHAELLQLHVAHDTATLHTFVGKIADEERPDAAMAYVESAEIPELADAPAERAWAWLEERAAAARG